MIPTQIALHLAADRQRELEGRAARRRLAHQIAAANCRTRRVDAILPALRRIAATLPLHHQPSAATAAVGPTDCCCAA